MARRLLPALVAVLLTLGACAAHEKTGDRAAATGDWKTAERAYAEALRGDPDKKELQDKYRQARTAALGDATRRAEACTAGLDWECAFAEADYALRLDPGAVPMAALRSGAGRELGYARVRRAGDAAASGDVRSALALLQQAAAVTDDAGVAAELRRVSPPVVGSAVERAERLRAERQYEQAIDLLGLAAAVDPAQRGRLDALRAEHERFQDAEAERYAQEGEARLAARRFSEAKVSFEAATRLRPASRAAPLARYAGHLAAAETAIGRRDFAAAERALAEALRVGVADGIAAAELDRVRVRPYAIRLRSVLVRATRPDGWPWAGARGRELDRVVARLASFDGAARTTGLAVDLARRVPPENQPELVVTVSLPDGRTLRTPPRRGVYALLDGSVVVLSNAYDDRTLALHVAHQLGGGARPMDVGLVSFRLGDVVAARGVAGAGQSVVELRLEADPADAPEGTTTGLAPLADAGNLSTEWSVPAPGAHGFRLVQVDAASAPGGAAAPDLAVEIEQRGRVVYRSPVAPRRAQASWAPPAAFLFASPEETLRVRLVVNGAPALAEPVTGAALERGAVDLRTAAGASVRLRLEPRRTGPGSA
jgi:tetratricopeptide (TPR) repeat protein